jgi:hypothetical protein
MSFRPPDFETGVSSIPPPRQLVLKGGVEPPRGFPHRPLKPACLPFHHLSAQSGWPDSNRRSPVPQTGTLAARLHPDTPDGIRTRISGV